MSIENLPLRLHSAPGYYGQYLDPENPELAKALYFSYYGALPPYARWTTGNDTGWQVGPELKTAHPSFAYWANLMLEGIMPGGEWVVRLKTADKEGTRFAYVPQADGTFVLKGPLSVVPWDTNQGILEDPILIAMLVAVATVGAGAAGAFGSFGSGTTATAAGTTGATLTEAEIAAIVAAEGGYSALPAVGMQAGTIATTTASLLPTLTTEQVLGVSGAAASQALSTGGNVTTEAAGQIAGASLADGSFVTEAAKNVIAKSGNVFSEFDVTKFLTDLGKIYATVELQKKAGASVKSPIPGTRSVLPDGSILTVNPDGSTTITRPDGSAATVSGQGIAAGAYSGQLIPGIDNTVLMLGAGGLLALFLFARR